MRKLLLLLPILVLCCLSAVAQTIEPAHSVPQPADCQIGPYTVTATGRSAAFDNRVAPAATGLAAGCTNWTLVYFANSAATLSIELDEAPDAAGTAGSWVIWPAADVGPQSVMPLTTLTGDNSSTFEYYPWVSINLTTLTGAGANVTYLALGYRPKFGADAGGIGNTPANIIGVTDPCANLGVLKSSVAINLVAAGTTQPIAPSGTTIIYVCGGSFTIAPSGTTADSLQFITGTGATCGTGTATKTGTYGSGDLTTAAPPISVDLGSNGSGMVFSGAAGAGLCFVAAGTTVNIQGVLTYVQQ